MMRRNQVWTMWKIAYWSFYLPFLVAKQLYRLIGKVCGTISLLKCDAVVCPACGDQVSLVARWECSWCGFVFDGFAFARCEICSAVPPFIECQSCGLTIRNPSLF